MSGKLVTCEQVVLESTQVAPLKGANVRTTGGRIAVRTSYASSERVRRVLPTSSADNRATGPAPLKGANDQSHAVGFATPTISGYGQGETLAKRSCVQRHLRVLAGGGWTMGTSSSPLALVGSRNTGSLWKVFSGDPWSLTRRFTTGTVFGRTTGLRTWNFGRLRILRDSAWSMWFLGLGASSSVTTPEGETWILN